jgi:hypothetical protein
MTAASARRAAVGSAMSSGPDPEELPDTDVVVSEDLATLRSYELDALSSSIPPDLCDRMVEMLSDDDVATLKHLTKEGMEKNSLRARSPGLNYLETWSNAATSTPPPWPVTEKLIHKFIATTLYDVDEQAQKMPRTACPETSPRRYRKRMPSRRRAAGPGDGQAAVGTCPPFTDGAVSAAHSSSQTSNAIRLAARAAKRPSGLKSANPGHARHSRQ